MANLPHSDDTAKKKEELKALNLLLQKLTEENNRLLCEKGYDTKYELGMLKEKMAEATSKEEKASILSQIKECEGRQRKGLEEIKKSDLLDKINILQEEKKKLEILIYGKPLSDSPHSPSD